MLIVAYRIHLSIGSTVNRFDPLYTNTADSRRDRGTAFGKTHRSRNTGPAVSRLGCEQRKQLEGRDWLAEGRVRPAHCGGYIAYQLGIKELSGSRTGYSGCSSVCYSTYNDCSVQAQCGCISPYPATGGHLDGNIPGIYGSIPCSCDARTGLRAGLERPPVRNRPRQRW
jgi:hypothetical protein